MDVESINAILEYLKEKAATISEKDVEELKEMKAELDEYVDNVTSKMPEQSRDVAQKEFEKCRVCAREWIAVYRDPAYHEGVKADILKEEAMEFFFTMHEKIVAVQKNFFLLGMIDELLQPSEPFSDSKREAKIANSRIRILAREQGLTASCTIKAESVNGGTAEQRYWYFGDERNFLQSSDAGLTDEEAIDYLLS